MVVGKGGKGKLVPKMGHGFMFVALYVLQGMLLSGGWCWWQMARRWCSLVLLGGLVFVAAGDADYWNKPAQEVDKQQQQQQ